ncbi:MAG: hypothetical protein JW779_08625 [Candidatus Thorarchaeota archaeon]|nr:hypothetical protein [Candidatus Thorarchaeota archaeon]
MIDMIVGIVLLTFTGILIVCIPAFIGGLTFRWIGASTNNVKTYGSHQTRIDYIFDVMSLIPSFVVSYFWSAYLLTFIFEVLTGYAPPYTTIGGTIIMWILLALFIWKIHQIRHNILENGLFSKDSLSGNNSSMT